jgi:hypothetical protein
LKQAAPFSIAITAWSAKGAQERDLPSRSGAWTRAPGTLMRPMAASPRSIGMIVIAR